MKINTVNNSVSIASPAKLNLFLEVLARRDDGFHEIETAMTKFSLFDYLKFLPTNDGQLRLTIRSHRKDIVKNVPSDEKNLIIKTLLVMRDLAGCSFGATIQLFKNIPVQAGLGGASGNAAATMLAANRIWKLNWPLKRLLEIASSIGSDVAFFLGNNLARCTGKGDEVHNLNYPCRLNIVVAKPDFGMSTSEIYARCNVPARPINIEAILAGLKSGRLFQIGKALFNRLELVASDANNGIASLRREFEKTNCVGHQLTGSGSCYYGIYRSRRSMTVAAEILANRLPDVEIFTGQTLSSGNHYLKHKDQEMAWK